MQVSSNSVEPKKSGYAGWVFFAILCALILYLEPVMRPFALIIVLVIIVVWLLVWIAAKLAGLSK
jgi:hypothetical protein